jgi:Transposase IS116/IS110/IS902 family
VPAIWLPDPRVRTERERARWRLHLVRHRLSLKQRVHAVLLTHGKPCPSPICSASAAASCSPGSPPWQGTLEASLRLIDELERELGECERELRRLGADHRYVPLLCTVPGISWVLAYTIAAEIGDIGLFPTPRKLAGYSGLCPRVYQSGERDLRGPLAKDPATSAGHSSKPPRTPAPTPSTATATSAPRPGSANNAAPRLPRSTSPADSPKRSGTCSPATSPSLRQAPPTPGGLTLLKKMRYRSELRSSLVLPRGGDREMSHARHPRRPRPP